MPRYRHIIWDWNGTLIDDLDYSIELMNGLLAKRRLPLLDRTRYHEVFGFPVRDYYYRLGFNPEVDSFEQLSVEFITAYDAHRWDCPLHTATRSTLEAARNAGLSQSILSAYRHETLVELVEHFDLSDFFRELSGLDNIYAHSKAELGRAQVAVLGLDPCDMVMIGDTLHDLHVAQELGVQCILVAAGHNPVTKLRQHHDQVVSSLSELPNVAGLEALR